jgi:dTMP kinase
MTTTQRGLLIAFEGIDGCGKTTQAARLALQLGAVLTREPGATPLGFELRRLALHPSDPSLHAVERAEALIMAADRAQHVETVIAPALELGRHVVTDRFNGSTFAYQGYGRGINLGKLRALDNFATAGLAPDLTILIDVPLDVANARRTGTADHIEKSGREFFERVANGFRVLCDGDASWILVDGTGSLDDVASLVDGAVTMRLGEHLSTSPELADSASR